MQSLRTNCTIRCIRLDDEHKEKHWDIPAEFTPEDYPELLEMEKIATKYVKQYINDFHLNDTYAYCEGGNQGIWLLHAIGIRLFDIFLQ